MGKSMFGLIMALLLTMAMMTAGCSSGKDDLEKGLDGLKSLAGDLEELNKNGTDEESDADSDEDTADESGSEDNASVSPAWPEEGYESIPVFKGRCIWLTDGGNYFSAVFEDVSEKEFKAYRKELLDAGYELQNESGDSYNYMLGDITKPKSLVGLTYQDGKLTISGSLH